MEIANEFASLIRRPIERLWHALTKEKIKEAEIQGLIGVFMKSLENKEFVVKEGMVELPIEELEKEPAKVASELLAVLKNIEHE